MMMIIDERKGKPQPKKTVKHLPCGYYWGQCGSDRQTHPNEYHLYIRFYNGLCRADNPYIMWNEEATVYDVIPVHGRIHIERNG